MVPILYCLIYTSLLRGTTDRWRVQTYQFRTYNDDRKITLDKSKRLYNIVIKINYNHSLTITRLV